MGIYCTIENKFHRTSTPTMHPILWWHLTSGSAEVGVERNATDHPWAFLPSSLLPSGAFALFFHQATNPARDSQNMVFVRRVCISSPNHFNPANGLLVCQTRTQNIVPRILTLSARNSTEDMGAYMQKVV